MWLGLAWLGLALMVVFGTLSTALLLLAVIVAVNNLDLDLDESDVFCLPGHHRATTSV
jgi:hypothetical protein